MQLGLIPFKGARGRVVVSKCSFAHFVETGTQLAHKELPEMVGMFMMLVCAVLMFVMAIMMMRLLLALCMVMLV